jgi:DNA-binding LacI/PurR family transcriptional regulator
VQQDSGGKPAVIADVARLAGVSVPTVSRVLTGADHVRPSTRERILAAIEELDYHPSATARALVSKRSNVIGVITGDTSRFGSAETIRGIEVAARAAGYVVTLTFVETDDADEIDRAVRLVVAQRVAGIAVLKFDDPGVAAVNAIPSSIPVVAISGAHESTRQQALLDETGAAKDLVEYLLGLGHRTVHHIAIPGPRHDSRRLFGRSAGWKLALTSANLPVPEPLQATWDPNSGRELGGLLGARPEVTAIFCGNDEIAIGAIRGVVDVGRKVPEDVTVVGFDDHPFASLWSPSITTVRQDFMDLGRRACRQLLGTIEGTKVPRVTSVRPKIVVRESSSPPSPAG